VAVTNVGQPVAAIKSATSSANFTSFSPNSGSGYVVCVGLVNGPQTAIPSSTVAWASGGSGSWSKLTSLTVDQFSPACELWYVKTTSAPGSSQISVTGNATVSGVYATISEITGEAASPLGQTASGGGLSSAQLSITPNATGSLCWQVGDDTFEGFTPTANGSSTVLDGWNDSGQELFSTVTSSNTTAATPVTVGCTNTVSAGALYMLVVEIKPAPAAAASGGALSALPGLAWRRHFKHRQLLLPPGISGPQNYTQNLTAGLSFTGAFTKATSYHLTAALSFTGSLTKRTTRTLTGALSFAGAYSLRTGKLLTAALSFTGAQTHAVSKSMTAALSFTGALPRAVAYHLTAALSFTGALTKRTTHTLTGGLSFTGSMSATIVIKRTLTAGLSFTGSLSTAVVHFFTQNLTAALSFTGAFTKRPGKALTAALSFTGAQSRRIGHLATAGLSFAGTQARAIRYHIAAALTSSGAVTGFNPNAVGPPPYTVTSSTTAAAGVTSTSSTTVGVTSTTQPAVMSS